MIPGSILDNTFLIKWNKSQGSAFKLEHIGRQYLVTARHIVEGINSGDHIKIRQAQGWENMNVDVVGIGANDVDVAVLSCPNLPSHSSPPEISTHMIGIGHQVYFVGYPFGWHWEAIPSLVEPPPSPYVKSGILSGAYDDHNTLAIDGHGNVGFSGGPVIFNPQGQGSHFFVLGVVSFYPTPVLEPVVDKNGDIALDHNKSPVGYVQENPGFLAATGIKCVTDLINTNPIGTPNPHSPLAPQSHPASR